MPASNGGHLSGSPHSVHCGNGTDSGEPAAGLREDQPSMKLTSLRVALTGAALVACGLRAVPAAESAAAAGYWTPDRMRAATPADVLLAGTSASTPAAEVAKGAPVT